MRLKALLVILVVAFLLAGCSKQNRAMNARLKQMARARTVEADYRVAPPDSIEINVKGYPEYSSIQTVRPDGKITVPSVGDICVQGMTLPEITKVISDGLSKELSQPNVTLILRGALSKAVYVLGEVRRPGIQPYYGDMTLMDALGTGAGISYFGDIRNISVTRESLDNPQIYKIDLAKLVYNGRAEQNMVLQEGDIIYVAPTPWASVGYVIDQALFPFRSILGGLVTYGGARTALDDINGNNTTR